MHSNVYSCLFLAANIKEENIIDSQVNVVYLTTNKRVQNTCFFLYLILKLTEGLDCLIIKNLTPRSWV